MTVASENGVAFCESLQLHFPSTSCMKSDAGARASCPGCAGVDQSRRGVTAPRLNYRHAKRRPLASNPRYYPNALTRPRPGFVSMEHGTEIFANMALYDTRNSGCFTGHEYENLGGVAIFWMGNTMSESWYEMRLFLNPFATEPLPEDVRQTFVSNDPPVTHRKLIIEP